MLMKHFKDAKPLTGIYCIYTCILWM